MGNLLTSDPTTERTDEFNEAVTQAPPVTLAEINAEASMMTRQENKYFAPAQVIRDVLSTSGARVLEIRGERRHRYDSLYFDTPDLLFLRQQVQGRRNRCKVRIRTYASGESFLEVKSKGARGQTVKERKPLPSGQALGPVGRKFLYDLIGAVAEEVTPVLKTTYERVTFVSGGTRITCDHNLKFHSPTQRWWPGPDEILVETKSVAGRSTIDRRLWAHGIRPVTMSKYGVGLSLLDARVPANKWHRVLRRHFGVPAF